MPDETDEEREAREAAEKEAAEADTTSELDKAKKEAEAARTEAEKARTDGQIALADAAEQRATAAEERATAAEERAKTAAGAKDSDGKNKYSEEYVKKLRDEAAKHRVGANDAKGELQKFKDAAKTEAERVADAIKEAETRAEKAERELLRIRVATDKNVPAHLASRLVGDTKEELEADADSLLKDVAPAGPGGGGLDQGPRGGSRKPNDMNDWMRSRAGIQR